MRTALALLTGFSTLTGFLPPTAPGGIAGSDGDGWCCGVVVDVLCVHFFCLFRLFALSPKSAGASGTCQWGGPWEWSSEGTTVCAPHWHSAVKVEDD
jgi:hypothetical protein